MDLSYKKWGAGCAIQLIKIKHAQQLQGSGRILNTQTVSSGQTLSGTSLKKGQTEIALRDSGMIDIGEEATALTVPHGGGVVLLDGAGRRNVVSSGVTVSSQTVSSGGVQTVLAGGTAIDTTVLGSGLQKVSGTTIRTVLTRSIVGPNMIAEGMQIVYAGGRATR